MEKIKIGRVVCVRETSENAKGTVIFCPGIGSPKERYDYYYPKFVEAGFEVIGIDFVGLGESELPFEEKNLSNQVEDLNTVIDFVGHDVALFGSSFGGTTIVMVAGQDPRVKCLATIAAAGDVKNSYKGELYSEVMEKGVFHRGWKTYKKLFVEDWIKFNPYDAAKNISVPWLMFYGTEDDSVPKKVTDTYLENAAGEKELVILEGAGHVIENQPEYEDKVIQKSIEWFNKYL